MRFAILETIRDYLSEVVVETSKIQIYKSNVDPLKYTIKLTTVNNEYYVYDMDINNLKTKVHTVGEMVDSFNDKTITTFNSCMFKKLSE